MTLPTSESNRSPDTAEDAVDPLQSPHGVSKIVSGGQTGVDRAALDVALALNINHGGWCPKGRIAEDGQIPERYRLDEHKSSDYAARTEQNVVDSDGTLILYVHRMSAGTALTNRLAKKHGKALHRVRLDRETNLDAIIAWIHSADIRTLNVAGPRASSHPEVYDLAYAALLKLMRATPRIPNLG